MSDMNEITDMSEDDLMSADMVFPSNALRELAYYCRKVEELDEKTTGFRPMRGEGHIWVEEVENSDKYIIYIHSKTFTPEMWYAMVFDNDGQCIGGVQCASPFDYAKECAKWLMKE